MAARLNVFLLVLAALLGMARVAVDRITPADSIARRIGPQPRPAVLRGVLLEEPEFAERGRSSRGWLRVESIRSGEGWTGCSGKLQLRLPAEAGLLLSGDRVELYGLLRPPRSRAASRFDERRWLWVHGASGIFSVSDPEGVLRAGSDGRFWFRYRRWTDRFRRSLRGMGRSLLEPEDAGFLEALLLGESRGIARTDWEAFRKTGTVHVLVVSGLHVGLIAGICLLVLAALRLPRMVCYGALSAILVTYCLVTGMHPPIVRSTVGGLLFCWAKARGIPHSALNGIGAAAAVLLAADPRMLADVSFQLSFAAVLAVFLADGWAAGWRRRKVWGPALHAATVSSVAWGATLPILAWHFHGVSLWAPAANLIAVPWASALVAAGFLVYASGGIWPASAGIFAAAFTWASRLLVRGAQAAASWPWGYWRW